MSRWAIVFATVALAWTPVREQMIARGPGILPAAGNGFYGLTPQFAVSPDGRRVVYVAAAGFNAPRLWVQSISDVNVVPAVMPNTEQASYPFWSSDGSLVGFFAGGKLKTIAIAGGPPTVICDAPTGRGGTWNSDGLILFTSGITDPL